MRHFMLSLVLVLSGSFLASSAPADDGKQLVVQQWVANSPSGQIDVAIVARGLTPETLATGEVRASLVSQDGAIFRAVPSANSPVELSFKEVPAGSYTLVARGPDLVACYAIHVVDGGDAKIDSAHHQLVISAAPMRINKVRGAIVRYSPTSVPFVAEFDSGTGANVMKSLNHMQTMRVGQTNGGMSGRVYRAGAQEGKLAGAAMTNIMVYRDRELIAQAVTEQDGSFTIDSLEPGTYGLIAIGPDGLAVMGFTLVDELVAKRSGSASANGETLVALQGSTMQPGLELQLAPAGSESPAVEELLEEDEQSEEEEAAEDEVPFDYDALAGSVNGPGGYGGGAGGGGPGAGGLLIGGAIIAAAFAADDDGSSFTVPPPTSPLNP